MSTRRITDLRAAFAGASERYIEHPTGETKRACNAAASALLDAVGEARLRERAAVATSHARATEDEQ